MKCTKETLLKQFGKEFVEMNGMVRELKRSKESATGKTKTQVREFINLDVLICLLIPYILSPFFVLLFDDWKLLNSCKLRFRWIYRNMSLGNMSFVLSKHEFGCDWVCQLVIIMIGIPPDTGWIERAYSSLELICANRRNKMSISTMTNLLFLSVLK